MSAPDPRRVHRRWPWIVALIGLAVLVAADRAGLLLVDAHDDLTRYHGREVNVHRVISPHTLEVDVPDLLSGTPVTRIRLWGVTAPLPARPGREADPWSAEAMVMSRRLVENRTVVLQLEPAQTRGSLGRVLAHVDIEDGGSLNVALLEAGLARLDDRTAHSRLLLYGRVERLARQASRGLWSD